MRSCLGALLFSAAIVLGGCGSSSNTGPKASEESKKKESDEAKELEQLKGTWRVTKLEAAGNAIAADSVKKNNVQYIFEGNRVTIHRPGRFDKSGIVTIDATTNPKRITFKMSPVVRACTAPLELNHKTALLSSHLLLVVSLIQ